MATITTPGTLIITAQSMLRAQAVKLTADQQAIIKTKADRARVEFSEDGPQEVTIRVQSFTREHLGYLTFTA